uniref:Complex I-B14.7 n=1 Tax=Octactis speculum TaxID=3111310 RepID=A0A7S2DQV7_9STRA|mmetsp:Transcript_52353/g.71466  ORF Transcript_52353/g.71466 Transcript_52353/m.71466 type:complete len:158 (+) Transcript_52353:58-531(+)|eukprot:CAMPEP_0185775490 /NCGR_PEP_ID=MMETSP1174-20130828/82183_1 /TAXON_ID=35687 /ORGANISM="Dictyocha speculum, Strain CCMP1381" /LENGTH=157 /DNA_ID=CAMNT_0028463075 /DNA_START=40 /DNA_END=513 /DNA_ORIENTATION=+
MAETESCAERVFQSAGAGAAVGAFTGATIGAFRIPIGRGLDMAPAQLSSYATAQARMPRLAYLVGSNSLLMSGVGVSYAFGKCIAENIYGRKSPLNGGFGGLMAGVALGLHTKNLTVMMGAGAGLAFASIVAEINGPRLLNDADDFKRKTTTLSKRE